MNIQKQPRIVVVLCVLLVSIVSPTGLAAQAAISCPPYSPAGPNLLQNPNFNTVGPCGTFTWWENGNGNCAIDLTASAANKWTTHSDNYGSMIRTYIQPSTLPIGGSPRMLHILSAGGEAGVYQLLPRGLTKIMASAWVFVRKGHVVMQSNGGTTGPNSWNSKWNQWELLRTCTDGTVPVDMFLVYNENGAGSDFDVDRVEVRVIN
jgi:hypothetical protein